MPTGQRKKRSPSEPSMSTLSGGSSLRPFSEEITFPYVPDPCFCTWVRMKAYPKRAVLKFRHSSCPAERIHG